MAKVPSPAEVAFHVPPWPLAVTLTSARGRTASSTTMPRSTPVVAVGLVGGALAASAALPAAPPPAPAAPPGVAVGLVGGALAASAALPAQPPAATDATTSSVSRRLGRIADGSPCLATSVGVDCARCPGGRAQARLTCGTAPGADACLF